MKLVDVTKGLHVVFLGDQLCENGVDIQHFTDCLCLCHQCVDVTRNMTVCCIYTHSWLAEPGVLVCECTSRETVGGVRQSVIILCVA